MNQGRVVLAVGLVRSRRNASNGCSSPTSSVARMVAARGTS